MSDGDELGNSEPMPWEPGSRPGCLEYVELRNLASFMRASGGTISRASASELLTHALDLYEERWQFWRQARSDANELEKKAKAVLTDAERSAIEYTLTRLAWPPDATQMELLARSLGPVCVTPEHSVKATLRGLLRRLGYTATTDTQEGEG